jgi:hypothetical protein
MCWKNIQWLKVRHIKTYTSNWHTAEDLLSGTAAANGDPEDDTGKWSLSFSNIVFDKYLLTTGDFKYWMII